MKMGFSDLWQPRQSTLTFSFRRKTPLREAWGRWQVRHPFSTGLCLCLTLEIVSPMDLWQVKQSAFPVLTRLFLLSEECGSWHFMHCPSATTLCTLCAFAGTIPPWQTEHILAASAARSFPWDDAWGLWQPV